jgi:hypothetical protein
MVIVTMFSGDAHLFHQVLDRVLLAAGPDGSHGAAEDHLACGIPGPGHGSPDTSS